MKKILLPLFLLSVIATPSYAQPIQKYDEQNRLVMQSNEDGSVTTYSYDEQGKRTVNANSKGQEIHFDKKGNAADKSNKNAH